MSKIKAIAGLLGSMGKAFEPIASTSWHYFKAESMPPFSSPFVNGPLGASVENFCSGVLTNFIKTMEGKVKDIEEQERQEIAAKEAEMRAAAEQAAAEAKEKERLKKEAAAAEAQKAKAAKKEEPKKPEPKKDPPKKGTDEKKKGK